MGIYWNNHHHMFHLVQRVSGAVLWANLALLFCLSMLPFTTAWMDESGFEQTPVVVYGLNLLAAGVAYFVLQTVIIRHEGPLSPLWQAVGKDVKGKISPVLYIAGILSALMIDRGGHVGVAIALACFVGAAILWIVPDRRVDRAVRQFGIPDKFSHPFRWRPLQFQVGDGPVGTWRLQSQRPVRAAAVVVARVRVQRSAQVPPIRDEHPVDDLRADSAHEPLRVRVGPWVARSDLAHGDAGIGQHRVERGSELATSVADEEPEPLGPLAQVHEQVAGLLQRPRPGRVRRHAQDVHVATADVHHEEHVQALQSERAVDVEEVARRHGRCLGAQERSCAWPGCRRRHDVQVSRHGRWMPDIHRAGPLPLWPVGHQPSGRPVTKVLSRSAMIWWSWAE
jgi:uncharacterized membrane protein